MKIYTFYLVVNRCHARVQDYKCETDKRPMNTLVFENEGITSLSLSMTFWERRISIVAGHCDTVWGRIRTYDKHDVNGQESPWGTTQYIRARSWYNVALLRMGRNTAAPQVSWEIFPQESVRRNSITREIRCYINVVEPLSFVLPGKKLPHLSSVTWSRF